MMFEVWSEGYLVTGMDGIPAKAEKMGQAEAETFEEACKIVCSEPPYEARFFDIETSETRRKHRENVKKDYLKRGEAPPDWANGPDKLGDKPVYKYWGCTLFPDEESARKSFG